MKTMNLQNQVSEELNVVEHYQAVIKNYFTGGGWAEDALERFLGYSAEDVKNIPDAVNEVLEQMPEEELEIFANEFLQNNWQAQRRKYPVWKKRGTYWQTE